MRWARPVTDEADPAVAAFEEVPNGQLAAGDVVDRHRAVAPRGAFDVEHHDGDAAFGELAGRPPGGSDRDVQHAEHIVLGEHRDVARLLVHAEVAVAHDDEDADFARHVLDTARDVGEERVGNVGHDDQPEAGGQTRCERT